MKNIKKAVILVLCALLCVSLFGCGGESASDDEKAALDTVLTEAEQKEYSKIIDDIEYPKNPDWSFVWYYGISDAVDDTSAVGLKGLPVLITKSVENESLSGSSNEFAEGIVKSNYQFFSFAAIAKINYYSDLIGNVMKPSLNYHNLNDAVKNRLPEISSTENSPENKLLAYRDYGVFAAPYVIKEIEAGNTELEPFFGLIGAHLSVHEHMTLLDRYDPVKYKDTPPPTKEEIDAMLIEGAKDFDYKKWYAENKTDIENLEKFLDAYCAE